MKDIGKSVDAANSWNRIDANGQAVAISFDNDVQLFVAMKQGEEVDKDCSCNSAFMEKVMPDSAK